MTSTLAGGSTGVHPPGLVEPLFDWYDSGEVEVEVKTATADLAFHLTPQSADHWGKPYFRECLSAAELLGNPTTSMQGDRVTHLIVPACG